MLSSSASQEIKFVKLSFENIRKKSNIKESTSNSSLIYMIFLCICICKCAILKRNQDKSTTAPYTVIVLPFANASFQTSYKI